MIHSSNRVFEAATKLRHMKDIMNLRKVRWKFQSICNLSTPFKNSERTNKAWSWLALDTEAVSTLHWCNTKIRLFTRLIDHIFMMAVILTLLTCLSNPEILTNNAHLFSGLLGNIRTDE